MYLSKKLKLKKILIFVLLSVLLLPSATSIAYAAEDGEASEIYDSETNTQLANKYEPNVIIIKFIDKAEFLGKEKQYDDAVNKVLGTGFELISENTYLVRIEDMEKNPNAVLNRFKNNKFIEYVEPNYVGAFELAPTDPNYNTIGSMYSKYINAEAGWDIITRSNVLVAIVDSGYSGSSDLPAASGGYSVFNKNTDLTDVYGHGTQVAGTLGAVGGNGDKNVGIVWNAKILPVKLSESSTITVANVASGIIYAADKGAKVINLSLSFASSSTTLKNAIDYAYEAGCVIIAATGNDSKGTVNYPAAYSNVLGVGGTSNGTARNTNSNYGTGLDVVASWNWYSTTIRDNNTISSGTSIATPQVSGLAALVWELNPSLSNAQVMELIRNNTNRADGVWNSETGYGTIDMGKTLKAASAGVAPPKKDDTAPVITLSGDQVIEVVQGESFIDPGYSAIDDTDGNITGKVVVTGSSVNTNVPGVYKFEYTVSDNAGNTSKMIRNVEVTARPAPELTLLGELFVTLEEGEKFIEPGYTATDIVDGDISNQVTVEGTVDVNIPGTYTLSYKVSYKADLESEATRIVDVIAAPAPEEEIDTTPPEIALLGEEEVILMQGDAFIDPGYTATDDFDGDITHKVIVEGKVDVFTPGYYNIVYTIADSSGNITTANRGVTIVVLTESEPILSSDPEESEEPETPVIEPEPEIVLPPPPSIPTLTIIGSNPIVLHLGGTPYTEQGAKAYDETDGDISRNVQITGNVNTAKAGNYTVNYKITNSAGKIVTETRQVRVIAPTVVVKRQQYGFSGQGKAVTTDTHKGIVVDASSILYLTTSNLGKSQQITVKFVDAATNKEVLKDIFIAANEKRQYKIEPGNYNMIVSIDAGSGNEKYKVDLSLEVETTTFAEEEIPLPDTPFDNATYTYVVVAGDSLWRIAQKHYGDGARWREIYDMNKEIIGNNPNRIYVGQTLKINAK